jgi:hypothetical protein
MKTPRVLCALLLLTLGGTAAAQKVYKSIDADGNVIYSASPPANVAPDRVEPVRIDPPPAESEQQAARQRLESALDGSGGGSGGGSGDESGSGPGLGEDSAEDRRNRAADAQPAEATAPNAEARFLERNRSNSRVSRGAGVGGGQQSSRGPGERPASRDSR